MKRICKPSTLARAALCTLLATGILCACAELKNASSEVSTVGTTAQGTKYDTALLADGVLRLFYNNSKTTVLSGSTVLYRGDETQSISLVTDDITGETPYYLVTGNDEAGTNGRSSVLYDANGEVVYSFNGPTRVELAGGKLAVADWDGTYEAEWNTNQNYRILDLATGEETPLDKNANYCYSDGAGNWVVNVLADGIDYMTEWVLAEYNTTVKVYDADLQLLQSIEHCSASPIYNTFASDLAGWMWLSRYKPDEDSLNGYYTSSQSLLCTTTGEIIDNFQGFCGQNLICVGTEESGYSIRNILTGETVAEQASPCSVYLRSPDTHIDNYVERYIDYYQEKIATTGETKRLQAMSYGSTQVATLDEDGTLTLYDMTDGGSVVFSFDVDEMKLPEETDGVYLDVPQNGYVIVHCHDANYKNLGNRLYSADGLLYDTSDRECDYMYYLTDSEEGPLFAISYSLTSDTSLSDVVTATGEILYGGLGYAYDASNVPDGCFSARRGFDVGWMNADGEWVYCESIFSSLTDEDDNSYFW